MNINLKIKKLFVATSVVTTGIVVFLVYSLAGLNAQPVVFAEPPAFVERYAADMNHSDPSSPSKEYKTSGGQVASAKFVKLTADLSNEEVFVFNVMMDGESLDVLLGLFTHPEKAQRVKVAMAFAAVNAQFTHNEETGFDEKRDLFWSDVDVEKHVADIQNALFEALIASAKEGTANKIPYTLAWWMPVRQDEKFELLAWAAKHHPDPWVRRFCVEHVVRFGGNEELALHILQNRIHDPAYRVRKTVLEQRFRRFIG